MSEPTWERVKALFNEAAALSGDERAAWLARACADDDRLRAEVEALLASHDELEAVQPQTVTGTGAEPNEEDAGSVVGRYKLLQSIGEGGFGTVYMAEQEEPVRRRVALKIIKLGMDTKQVIARFEAERQALALMDHPNIAKVFDAGTTETGRPYFVMELVRGIPITEYCDRNKLSTRKRLELFMAVCGAVQHAHHKGVIHRDIKPSNVMVTLHDGTPVPKIIDFGIAKATNQRLTERTLFTEYNQFIGTPAYMSPEQAEMSGLDVDTRSDIYSLGVLLYELLTGTTPLDSRRLKQMAYSEIQRMIREEEPHRPSVRISTMGEAATTAAEQRRTDRPGLAKLLRGDLDWVVMKALEKDRTRRYETANAMREDLRRYVDNEPVSASPPGTLYRMSKFVRRNRVAVAVGAVVGGALLGGLLLAGFGLFQARREAAAAQAINGFFNDMLASIDPRHMRQFSGFTIDRDGEVDSAGELSHDVSVVDMMLRARKRIATSFAGKPELEARARETIGLSLMGLGRPREAAEELGIAAEIRRAALGPDHPDTLRSELQHAMSLTGSGRAPESIPLLDDLHQRMTRAYGEDDPRTLQTATLYATALMQNTQHGASDPIFRETLERQLELLGPEHRDTIETRMWWAASHSWRGMGAEAEALGRPAYEAALRAYGPNDVQTLYAQTGVGWTLNFQGKREEAEALLRPALEGLSKLVGDEHPFTCSAKEGLGRSLPDSSDEKLRLWTEAVEGLRASEGNASPWMYVFQRDLAFLLLRRGKTEEGLTLLRRAVEDFVEKYGENHPFTRLNLGHLVDGLRYAGNEDEAVEVSKRLLDVRRRAAEDRDADASAVNDYAWALLTWSVPELRDPAAALPLAERAMELAGDDRWPDVLDTLALALHMNGRNDEAIEIQREALALIPEDEAGRRTNLVARLVKYLVPAGAEAEAREAVVAHVRDLHDTSPTTGEFVRGIGGFSNRMAEHKLHAYAELARREALDIVRTQRDDDPAAVAGLLYRLGRALLHQGRDDEAERVLREGLSNARRADDEEVLTRVQINLAEVWIHHGRFREARDVAAEVVDRREEREDAGGGELNEETMEARRLLGTARLRLGDVGGAEPLLREAEEWFVRYRAPDAWRRARAESAWGEYLLAVRRDAEAEPLLNESRRRLEEALGADATATQDAARRIERLHNAP